MTAPRVGIAANFQPPADWPEGFPLVDSPGADDLAVFTLAGHLLQSWWRTLEAAATSGRPMELAPFLGELGEFLVFKELLPPSIAIRGEVAACPPGQVSIRGTVGLGWSGPLRMLINLSEVAAELIVAATADSASTLRLFPGEGCRLPASGILCDTRATSPDDAQIWLLLQIS